MRLSVSPLSRVATTLLASSGRCVLSRGVVSMVTVSDAFDSGNIERIAQPSSGNIELRIKRDPFTELEKKQHMQWFAFRATHAGEEPASVTYSIVNAHEASFPEAWPGYEVLASHDRETWRRVSSTKYDGKALSWEWTHSGKPRESTVYFAYFDTYSYERHLSLLSRCAAAEHAPNLRVRSLGQTLDGREIDCVSVGTGSLQAWVIHRQHPGESMAEFYAEGLLGRLLGLGSAHAVDALTLRLHAHPSGSNHSLPLTTTHHHS